MGKRTKVWLLIALSLVLVGCIVLGGVMTVAKWDFLKLSTDRYETTRHEISESYQNISIMTDTADIVFVPSADMTSSVVCYEQKNVKHSVAVKDGTLAIELVDARKWYEHIGIFFTSPKITVSIPQGEYGALTVTASTGDVEIPKEFTFESIEILESTGNVKNSASALETIKITTSTGNIRVEKVSAGSLELTVSTGKVAVSNVTDTGDVKVSVSTGKTELSNVACKNVISDGDTGRIVLNNVIAAEKIWVERDTGDVEFHGADAAELFVETDTGDVTGSLLTDKVFITETDTGRVDVPKSATGGKCQIKTDTGDIDIRIEK